jgi:putative flippase GtrA
MNLLQIKAFINNSKFAQFIRFFLVVSVSSIFELLAFYLLLFGNLHYQIALVISFTFGTILRYIYGRKFAFKSKSKKVATQFTAFFSISVFDLLINIFFMYVFVELVMFGPMLSRIFAGTIAFVIIYVCHKNISFNANLIK